MPRTSSHQRTYGQFFTPTAVVACCYELLANMLPAMPRIVDPACGDGVFLRYALERCLTRPDRVTGCDIDAELVAALCAEGLPGICHGDGLVSLRAGAFDLVVGNPPFGVATSSVGQAALPSEARFLLRAIELVRPGGLVALVLPSGVLANERLCALRDDVLQRCTALAVIALPRDAFRSAGTNAACSILVLYNEPSPPDHLVYMALAQRLDDLPQITAAYRAGASTPQATLGFWQPQAQLRAQRMDAPFWHPMHQTHRARLAARHDLRPLGELLDRQRDLIAGDHVRPSRGEAKGPGLPYEYYQTREFMAAGYNYASLEHCDERAYQRLRHTAVQRYDVLVSCAGVGGAGRGRVCLVSHEPGPSCTGDVLILRPRTIDPVFLFFFLSSRAGRRQLQRLQNGVSTANLSADELLHVELPTLTQAEQSALAASYAPIATAHRAAMVALQQHDRAAAAHARAHAEALLAETLSRLDILLLGVDE